MGEIFIGSMPLAHHGFYRVDGVGVGKTPMVRRYERRDDSPDDDTCDRVWIDRTTGAEVLRYDLGNPANWNPAYGGSSDRDWFAGRGLDIDTEVPLERCLVPVPPGEANRLLAAKERRAERDREEEDARELIEAFPDLDCSPATGYCNSNRRAHPKAYDDWEQDIATPAMQKAGYTAISFYDIERDSFGPLIRGVVAKSADGRRVRFFYG